MLRKGAMPAPPAMNVADRRLSSRKPLLPCCVMRSVSPDAADCSALPRGSHGFWHEVAPNRAHEDRPARAHAAAVCGCHPDSNFRIEREEIWRQKNNSHHLSVETAGSSSGLGGRIGGACANDPRPAPSTYLPSGPHSDWRSGDGRGRVEVNRPLAQRRGAARQQRNARFVYGRSLLAATRDLRATLVDGQPGLAI